MIGYQTRSQIAKRDNTLPQVYFNIVRTVYFMLASF
jgi:hypothetical protein